MSAASRRSRFNPSSYTNPNLRVSDAERTEVADRLAKHYADGRLDQAEFERRLEQAMTAKTQADLQGLFADLPGTDAAVVAVTHRHRHTLQRVLFLVLLVVVTVSVAQAFWWPTRMWLLIAAFVFLWLRFGPWHHHHHHHRDQPPG
jgi:Domain of unknown function (DUF1707)